MASLCFNPRPPLLAGDSSLHCGSHSNKVSFNPRPPLLAGDSGEQRYTPEGSQVSIHARHCWRATQLMSEVTTIIGEFQSTPAIAGGRLL